MNNINEVKRIYRHRRICKTMDGTAERPRLCIHRSLNNLAVSIVDDGISRVLMGKSTLAKDVKAITKNIGGNVKAAEILGDIVAKEALAKGIRKVCFDRGGYMYHGRVKAFAEAARKAGLEF